MLVLSRRTGEAIRIGDNIIIRVAEVKGDIVRLAIDAPREIKVHRGEVYTAIIEANQQAAKGALLPDNLPLPSLAKKSGGNPKKSDEHA